MRILLDTNIILDIALEREQFYHDSVKIFKMIDNETTFGFITATTVTDIYYIAKKDKGHKLAIDFISNLILYVDVIGIDKEIIVKALSSNLIDFEDSIQYAASSYTDIEFIITRNQKDFRGADIKVMSPTEFLRNIKINN